MDWAYGLVLIVVGQAVQLVVKHYADREQVRQLRRQTELLQEIANSRKG